MKFKRLQQRKKPNYKRAILLVLILLLVIYLWINAEDIITHYFNK